MRSANGQRLVQIVDAAVNEAVKKGGAWIACRPGCHQCCIGVFPIPQSDALRLRDGLRELGRNDPARATKVKQRAREAVTRYAAGFPGDAETGVLGKGPEYDVPFKNFGNDDLCPALDPETFTCDLYAARPITCRTFGPAIRLSGDSVDVCELCYEGASDEEIAGSLTDLDIAELAGTVEDEAERSAGIVGQTIVAYALR